MRLLAKIDDTLEIIEQAVVIFLFSALVLMITTNIFARNLFGVSYQKILEVSPNIVLWLALIGATLALKKQRHIKLEVLLRYAGHRTRRLARLLGSLFRLSTSTLGELIASEIGARSSTGSQLTLASSGCRKASRRAMRAIAGWRSYAGMPMQRRAMPGARR